MMRIGSVSGSEMNPAPWLGATRSPRSESNPPTPPMPGSELMAAGTPPAGARIRCGGPATATARSDSPAIPGYVGLVRISTLAESRTSSADPEVSDASKSSGTAGPSAR